MNPSILHEKKCWATSSPVGTILVSARGGKIISVEFSGEHTAESAPEGEFCAIKTQLDEYFEGKRRRFSLELDFSLAATPFREKVWALVAKIPYGETITYGDIARMLGSSPRAVGGAMHANPIPIFLPCHRVVAAGGLGGYSGDWESGKALSVKGKLLALEKGTIP